MKLVSFVRRYRWYLAAALLVYAGLSLWLWIATRGGGDGPFVYQVF